MEGAGTVVLGVSCDFHDAAAALLVDGVVAGAAEEERFTRRKHDASIPRHAIAAVLEGVGLVADDIDHVVFYEKPLSVVSRYLASRQRIGPAGFRTFLHDVPRLVGRNLMVGARLPRVLSSLGARRPPTVQFLEHHHSHGAAAFFASPHERAAILTIDGIGEWATATIGHGLGNRITLLEELRYPNSLGLAYSFVTEWCGFEPNEGEYKLMGLAPYGRPTYADALGELVRVHPDASVEVDARRLGWFSPRRAARDLSDALGGPPRAPDDPLTQREADLAASIQQLTETAVLGLAARARELTGEAALCMAGGVALNCVANGRIVRESDFDSLWVQPAAGDAGSAVGAALALWHEVLGHPRRTDGDAMSSAALGPVVAHDDAVAALDRLGIAHRVVDDEAKLVDEVAARLDAGAVVGWVQGRMEFGPRALGNRSILADPRDPEVRQRLNGLVKGRESFRPFAPAVLAEHAAAWFELEAPSPYMLVVAPVRAEHRLDVPVEPTDLAERARIPRSALPACTHVDGSARIQTVDAAGNGRFAALLGAFHGRTSCPVLVNTSFNLAGEPIVCTAEDAIRTATRGRMDLLVLGDIVVEGEELQRVAAGAETS